MSSAFSTLSGSNLNSFRAAVIQAIDKGVATQAISRLQAFRARTAVRFRPAVLTSLWTVVQEQMASENFTFVTGAGEINWEAIAQFLATIIPLIVEAILAILAGI